MILPQAYPLHPALQQSYKESLLLEDRRKRLVNNDENPTVQLILSKQCGSGHHYGQFGQVSHPVRKNDGILYLVGLVSLQKQKSESCDRLYRLAIRFHLEKEVCHH